MKYKKAGGGNAGVRDAAIFFIAQINQSNHCQLQLQSARNVVVRRRVVCLAAQIG